MRNTQAVRGIAGVADWICLVLLLWPAQLASSQGRVVTPRDCVQVRYVVGIWPNTVGTQVAYLVKAPNLATDRNDDQLYVRDLNSGSPGNGKLVFIGINVSNVVWLDGDRDIALIAEENGLKRAILVNTVTGDSRPLFHTSASVDAFSTDASGDEVVYAVADPPIRKSQIGEDGNAKSDSHRISFDFTGAAERPTDSLYLVRRDNASGWSQPLVVTIKDPFTGANATHLVNPMYLSLSPDGKYLLLNYFANGLPNDWRENPFVALEQNGLSRIAVLYQIKTGTTSLAFKTIYPDSAPLWSRDSASYLMNAHSPVGSVWESDDKRNHWVSAADANLFQVNVKTGRISEVFRHIPSRFHHDGPLYWCADGDVIVRSSWTSITRLRRIGNAWHALETINIPHQRIDRFDMLSSNGTSVLGTHETVSAPPDLFIYKPGDIKRRRLTNLNPQLESLIFAPVRDVHWTTSEGLNVNGLLFVPPNYEPGMRYPLVIQTKGDQGWFTCDAGLSHEPSFAPQPIATAGIMYLIRTFGPDWNAVAERNKRPKGYPGGIGEAIQQMDIWDSAVRYLTNKGMIDPSKVGIIGFSRTGWEVEFDLVHAHTRYAAATAADNIQYSLSEWWMLPFLSHTEEDMYGGPPLGKSLKSWKSYSISYNFDKIQTPLLIEEMGYGVADNMQGAVPTTLATSFEIARSLSRLGKPVELYYYPNDGHMPDHPRARLESVQRNLDWYRFWLQGYEAPDRSKIEMYKRWRMFKRQQDMERNSQNLRTQSVPRMVGYTRQAGLVP